jgi:hypothetical protein
LPHNAQSRGALPTLLAIAPTRRLDERMLIACVQGLELGFQSRKRDKSIGFPLKVRAAILSNF